jgi:hypothetical protein
MEIHTRRNLPLGVQLDGRLQKRRQQFCAVIYEDNQIAASIRSRRVPSTRDRGAIVLNLLREDDA